MIVRITGIVEAVEPLEVTLRPEGGLSYQVLIPAFLVEKLRPSLGKPLTLHTIEYLENQGNGSWYIPRLIGFATVQDRRFFDLLTSVDGLGNRKALRAMAQEPSLIARAILAADAPWLTKLPEIGRKTADKVILELKGKVSAFLTPEEIAGLEGAAAGPEQIEPDSPADEAVAALIALGETREAAERRVRAAMRRSGAETTEQIVAAALGA